MGSRDPMYIAALLTRIDMRVQDFLASCSRARSLSDVVFDTIDFAPEIYQIRAKAPIQVLAIPLAVVHIVNGYAAGVGNAKEIQGGGAGPPAGNKRPAQADNSADGGKKDKANKRAKGSPAKEGDTNPSVRANWALKPGENYRAVFNKNVKTAPKLNGVSLCAKYHVQGVCEWGQQCGRKQTHTNELTAECVNAMSAWVIECRRTA
jgi:hypothetical protein